MMECWHLKQHQQHNTTTNLHTLKKITLENTQMLLQRGEWLVKREIELVK